MTEHLNVAPGELRQAAVEHRRAAEQLGAAPASHDDVMATLDSLGPIFAEFRAAGAELLDQRRVCYEQQAAAHAELADRLNHAADVWESQDADSALRLRGVPGEGR
ncbi:MAG: ESX-1 secretion-associated protein [Mycobacterium sp.]|nr:ESX-1 secretion-associated protein [Mycobacterium sp.]